MTATAPQLAREVCVRRLRALDGPDAAADISWHGPARVSADLPGSEAVLQALCGLMEVHGRDAGRPRRLGLEVASVAAGLLATQGTVAAAIAGRRGHPVPTVQTSVLQAGLLLLSHYFVVATGLGDAISGPPLPAPGPPFLSADGVWFEIETLDAEPWKAFWARLGVGTDPDLGRAWTLFRWRYERAACSLPPALHEATRRLPLAELQRHAGECQVSLASLRTYADVLTEPWVDAAHPVVESQGGAGKRETPPAGAGTLPLAGIRVVEATSRIQGPFAGMLLRMLGAEVTRVQPPEGDYGRAALCLHRGKEAVKVDLSVSAGRAELVDLVTGADVFLHNWRPGKAAEWGLEAPDLAARSPGLVYATTSGWGERPEARRLVGTDFLVQAHTAMGDGLHPDGEPAVPSRMILCDLFGGVVGAEGILTALYRREATGGSYEVRSSLLTGAMALQAHVLEDIVTGTENGRHRGRPVWSTFDRPVPTADGDIMVSIDDDDAFARLCRLLDVDPSGASRDAVERRLHARLRDSAAASLTGPLAAAGIPAAVVCDDLAAVAYDPRFAVLFEPVGDRARAPLPPWRFG
jgi:CoA:oxalate CoA-transferase